MLGFTASACESVERVTFHTTNLAEVRQEDREFKNDAALPIREGTVVTTGVGLNLLPTVASPSSGGVTLQATVVHWVGDTLYGSYNARDDQFLGVIQVIDVTNRSRPVVVAEAVFPATDINRIRASGDQLFVAAADRVLGGTFERFRYRHGELTHLGFNEVGSYSATFLELEDYLEHVSYGDEDGGVRTFDVSVELPALVDQVTEHDARWAGPTTTGGLACVAGSPGRLTTMEEDGAVTGTEFIDGARIGVPTWGTQRGDRLYLSSDDAGLLTYDLRTLEELVRLATTGTSNGSEFAVDGRLGFLANGEEGIVVADLLSPDEPLMLAGLDVSDDAGSAKCSLGPRRVHRARRRPRRCENPVLPPDRRREQRRQ